MADPQSMYCYALNRMAPNSLKTELFNEIINDPIAQGGAELQSVKFLGSYTNTAFCF